MSAPASVRGKADMVFITPLTPNFIRTIGGKTFSVGDLDDETLRAIAKNWTSLLLLKASTRRPK